MKILLLLILTPYVYAQDFCNRSPEIIKELLENKESRLTFKNSGGILNLGVCWWHSRLQRSSLYLADYRPDLNKPSSKKLKLILKNLKKMNQVVIIPGFNNFYEFSNHYKNEIQKLLNNWQIEDGFINQKWIKGISGKSKLPSELMLKKMNNLFFQFSQSNTILWIMAQIKGIESHSFLLLDMKKYQLGYSLDLVDSNYPTEIIKVIYKEGDQFLNHPKNKSKFILYTGYHNDTVKIFNSLEYKCKNNGFWLDSPI